jgi:hypothetical protein
MPPPLPILDRIWFIANARVDFLEVPARREEAFHKRTRQRREQIHGVTRSRGK